jgi:hypothetical protein
MQAMGKQVLDDWRYSLWLTRVSAVDCWHPADAFLPNNVIDSILDFRTFALLDTITKLSPLIEGPPIPVEGRTSLWVEVQTLKVAFAEMRQLANIGQKVDFGISGYDGFFSGIKNQDTCILGSASRSVNVSQPGSSVILHIKLPPKRTV